MKKQIIYTFILMIVFAGSQLSARAQGTSSDTLAGTVSKLLSDFDFFKRIKISGYVQPQFQIADSAGIGSFAGGNFPANTDKRFSLRRGRLKVMYETSLTQYVLQIDATEKGVV